MRKEEISEISNTLGFLFFLAIIFAVGVLYILPIAIVQTFIEWLKEEERQFEAAEFRGVV